ncbi:hypothetical protein KAT95_01135 [Candidatus Parcubacteria bacterium]|nr:hypothetical protein [Candidatus Parcubacteria bacterium]
MRERFKSKIENAEEKSQELKLPLKEKRLKEIEKEVKKIADAEGRPIDPGIKETVITLKALEFPTYQSCEGHPAKRPEEIEVKGHQSRAPWVWIKSPEPKNLKESESVQKEWKKENLKHQSRMIELLDEFYKDREVAFDIRLHIESRGIYGAFAITNQGADVVEDLPQAKQEEGILVYQKEMQEFSKFLKEKYFQGEKK